MIIKSIIDAMSEALNKEFGTDYKIYTEAVRQGLKAPCFFISCVESAEEEKLIAKPYVGRYLRRQKMEVLYLPKDENYKSEYDEVTDRLYDTLYYIRADGDLIRGTELKSVIDKGLLIFSVTYEFFVERSDESGELMSREETRFK